MLRKPAILRSSNASLGVTHPARSSISKSAWIGARFTESLTRDHVGSDVEGGLYRNLQGVLDKPTLANVMLHSIGVGEFGELAQAMSR